MESRGAPEEVIEDPACVVDELTVLVGALQEGVVVGRVGGEQADDAAHEEPERRRAPSAVDRKSDHGGEQEHVAQWVRDRDPLCEPGSREVDVRGDQEDPREQADADRENQRVDQRGSIWTWIPPPDEQ